MGFLWKCNRHEHKYQRFGILSGSSVNNLTPQGLVQLYHQLWCLNRDVWSIWGVGKGEQKNPKVDLNEILSLRLCLNQTSPLGLDCLAVPPQPCSVPRQAVPGELLGSLCSPCKWDSGKEILPLGISCWKGKALPWSIEVIPSLSKNLNIHLM